MNFMLTKWAELLFIQKSYSPNIQIGDLISSLFVRHVIPHLILSMVIDLFLIMMSIDSHSEGCPQKMNFKIICYL